MISETTLGNQSRSKSSATVPAHTTCPLLGAATLPYTINTRNSTSRQHKMNTVIGPPTAITGAFWMRGRVLFRHSESILAGQAEERVPQ